MSQENNVMTKDECVEILTKLKRFKKFLEEEAEIDTNKISLVDLLKCSYIFKLNEMTQVVELHEILLFDEVDYSENDD